MHGVPPWHEVLSNSLSGRRKLQLNSRKMLKACLVRPCESYERNEIVMQLGSERCGHCGLASRDTPWFGWQIQPFWGKLLAPGWWNLKTEAAGSSETGIHGVRTRETVVLSSFCYRIEGCLLQWVLFPLVCVCVWVSVTSHVRFEVHTTMTIKIDVFSMWHRAIS